jgi:hypothetical protein
MQRISKYGETAVKAVEYMKEQGGKGPRAAWNQALRIDPNDAEARNGLERARRRGR